MKKKLSKAKHYAKLALVFNKYIRLRDCNGGGANCISCGEWKRFEELQAGHLWHSKSSILRFDERNVNAECINCNFYNENHLVNYRQNLERKIGREEVDKMLELRYLPLKMSPTEIDEKIKEYKLKLKDYE